MSVPVKLILACNINPGVEEAKVAFDYLTQEVPARMHDAGLKLADAWYTVYGTWPLIRMSFTCQNPTEMQTFLHSHTWQELKIQLQNHTSEFEYKVVISRNQFQF